MSDESVLSDLGRGGDSGRRGGGRRRSGCGPLVAALVVLVLLVGGGLYSGGSWLKDRLAGPEDYAGPGTGQVTFTIDQGETVSEMGRDLEKLDVVKSSEAFVSAASKDSGATGIQPGAYSLKKQMKASDVVAVLVDPKNLVQDLVTVPEGMRTTSVVSAIVEHTDFTKKAVLKALADGKALGLPSYAHGNPEGYLFPATYPVAPGDTPTTLLKAMVAKWRSETASIGLAQQAKAVNLDPGQAMTVASILEYEAKRSQDYPKVARAIYNRLKADMPIQSDATVSYASGVTGEVWTTAEQRSNPSAYNTYQHVGLPPGPIGNPGLETIKAALHPVDGPWLYWVVVNLKTGETDFATTLKQHNQQVAKAREYCKTSDAC